MELSKYKKIHIRDVCIWERAKKGKIYEQGSFGVQVSASKGQMIYLSKAQEVDAKYCVFKLTTDKYDSEYFFLIFQKELPEFLHRTQTGLNIVPDVFEKYEINLHEDIGTQTEIVRIMKTINDRIEEEKRMVENCQQMKEYHLRKMFC